ncbi:hypothetical protein HDV02_006415 [Globomyces sp. JEL0801]|nr:hypothetical protein HDV02_006415 [Globomyces sp. JEL0801]
MKRKQELEEQIDSIKTNKKSKSIGVKKREVKPKNSKWSTEEVQIWDKFFKQEQKRLNFTYQITGKVDENEDLVVSKDISNQILAYLKKFNTAMYTYLEDVNSPKSIDLPLIPHRIKPMLQSLTSKFRLGFKYDAEAKKNSILYYTTSLIPENYEEFPEAVCRKFKVVSNIVAEDQSQLVNTAFQKDMDKVFDSYLDELNVEKLTRKLFLYFKTFLNHKDGPTEMVLPTLSSANRVIVQKIAVLFKLSFHSKNNGQQLLITKSLASAIPTNEEDVLNKAIQHETSVANKTIPPPDMSAVELLEFFQGIIKQTVEFIRNKDKPSSTHLTVGTFKLGTLASKLIQPFKLNIRATKKTIKITRKSTTRVPLEHNSFCRKFMEKTYPQLKLPDEVQESEKE